MKRYATLTAIEPHRTNTRHPKWLQAMEVAMHDAYHELNLWHSHVDAPDDLWGADHTHFTANSPTPTDGAGK